MKRSLLLLSVLTLILAPIALMAQAPSSFNYQAVVRDAGGNILNNESVTMRFTIRSFSESGSIQYREFKDITTNQFGLASHAVGEGNVVSGIFNNIAWSTAPMFLQVELNAGSGYTDMGTQQLVSVPYAFNAKVAETVQGGVPDDVWNASGNNISNSNSGNVGLGTSSPIQRLDVNGRMNVANGVIQRGGSAITGTNDLGLYSRVVGNWLRFSTNNAHIRFFTNDGSGTSSNGTGSVMTIAPNGNVGIGVSEPGLTLDVNGEARITGGFAQFCNSSDNSQGNVGVGSGASNNSKFRVASTQDYGIFLDAPNANQWSIYVNGTAAKPGGGNWVAASDERLKENVTPYTDGLSELLNIRPVRYHYNERSGLDVSKEYIGVIAQELQEVAPYMVGESKVTENSEQEYLNVDNSSMTYMLVNAVKEQQQQIEALKAEIESLKNK